MPNYDFLCFECDARFSRVVPYEDRGRQSCECGGPAELQFPVQAVRGISVSEGGYCEPLGCDVSSDRDMVEKAKRLGFIQSGDKVRGGRNEESTPAVKLTKRRGVSIDDRIRERDVKAEQKENWKSYAQHSGKSETPVKESRNLKKAIKVKHLTANR